MTPGRLRALADAEEMDPLAPEDLRYLACALERLAAWEEITIMLREHFFAALGDGPMALAAYTMLQIERRFDAERALIVSAIAELDKS